MKIETVKYSHYGECRRLSNGTVDVLVTTDLGPRVIFYGFTGGTNTLAELGPDLVVKTDLGDWHAWGGHRLWHAPEVLPRSYSPDDGPIKAEVVGDDAVRVIQPVEPSPKIEKEMLVRLDAQGTRVTITHKLTNRNVWPVELAPWALTIMRGGGTTIFLQEPFISHDDYLVAARPVTLWHFTDMADPRWTWGTKYIRLRSDPSIEKKPQKVGVANKQGWAGYLVDSMLFIKRAPYIEGANYPDLGCNFETYTDGSFLEIETLGPLVNLEPDTSVEHVEQWYLFADVDADGGSSEQLLETAIGPPVNEATHSSGTEALQAPASSVAPRPWVSAANVSPHHGPHGELSAPSGFVFVGMPLDDAELGEAYAAIKDECMKLGLQAKRADENVGSGFIISEIQELIRGSELVIIDLTNERPNVYYELGFAEGVGKGPLDILLVAREGTGVHFDVASKRICFYRTTEQLRALVASSLSEMTRRARAA